MSDPTPVHAGTPVRLKELGYNEVWLQNRIASDPAGWLGLGEVNIVAENWEPRVVGVSTCLQQMGTLTTASKFNLEKSTRRTASVCSNIGLTTSRNFEGKTHVAVLVVESASGRYRVALEALAQYVPLNCNRIAIKQGAQRGRNPS